MRTKSVFAVVALTFLVGGSAFFLGAGEQPRRRYPKATPPPPPSPVYTPSPDRVPTEAEVDLSLAGHVDRLVEAIDTALARREGLTRREGAFAFLLPELLQVAPERAVELHARLARGEPRDTLRAEMARQWIVADRDAAMRWIASLDGAEKRDAAYAAVRELAAVAPDQAIHVAGAFDIGRDDGYLAHLVHIWIDENANQVERWMATQAEGPRTSELRTLIERARQRGRDRG